ncbi:MAG: O-antigen ligase family protein [Candidatus Omnitrophota bacterium]
MLDKNGNINFGIILLLLFLALLIVIYNIHASVSLLPFVFLLVPIIFFIAFTNTDFVLFLLIFFMLLSPEFAIGGIRGREVVLRIDDIFIFVAFFGWLAKMAVNKELGFAKKTPLNQPIIIYCFLYLIGTLYGVLMGTTRWQSSIFYFLKYVEYFLLYFMVVNSLKDRRQVKMFIYCMLAIALITSVFAWYLHFSGAERVTAPFEGKHGEPNTLGGYLLLMMMVATGLILNITNLKERIILSAGMCVAFPAFLFTLSRSSWFGFLPAYVVLMFLSRKGKHMLLVVSLLFILLFSVIFPKYVYQRIAYTFEAQTTRVVMGKVVSIDESSAARVDTFKDSIKHWMRSPILGNGAGSAGATVDNQYMRVLIETGIFGTLAFFLVLFAIWRTALNSLNKAKDDHFAHGLTAGFIAGFIGLLFHSLGAATFILIRIMEPFWFIAAIVVSMPDLPQVIEEA